MEKESGAEEAWRVPNQKTPLQGSVTGVSRWGVTLGWPAGRNAACHAGDLKVAITPAGVLLVCIYIYIYISDVSHDVSHEEHSFEHSIFLKSIYIRYAG